MYCVFCREISVEYFKVMFGNLSGNTTEHDGISIAEFKTFRYKTFWMRVFAF